MDTHRWMAKVWLSCAVAIHAARADSNCCMAHDACLKQHIRPGNNQGFGSLHKIELRQTANKGCGLFATSPIQRGEHVLCERPILYVVKGQGEQSIADSDLVQASSGLTEGDRLGIRRLASTDLQREIAPFDKAARNVLALNAFHLSHGLGLFRLTSRINHSCAPSLTYRWDATMGRLVVIASRSVAAGEELSISYMGRTNAQRSKEEREQYLKHYGFKCDCPACNQGKYDTIVSDKRRRSMGRLARGLSNTRSRERPLHNILADHVQMDKLLREEGLTGFELSQNSEAIAALLEQSGDLVNATTWWDLAAELQIPESCGLGLPMCKAQQAS